jgi:hypothetical protein
MIEFICLVLLSPTVVGVGVVVVIVVDDDDVVVVVVVVAGAS